jgi:hypothetical protein
MKEQAWQPLVYTNLELDQTTREVRRDSQLIEHYHSRV